MLFRDQRAAAAKQTQSLTPEIIRTTAGASADSTCYTELLEPLPPCKHPKNTHVFTQNGDTFTVAQHLISRTASSEGKGKSKVTVKVAAMNLASERNPGGGWLRGALAQEEALCLRSTLGVTLRKPNYPLNTLGAIWSPGVAVFRGEISDDCFIYESVEDRFVVGVVSVAGLRHPPLADDDRDYKFPKDAEVMQNKIRQSLRIMATNGITHCVLGALGCGVFGNPPRRVAQLFKKVIVEEEFKGYFEEIVFGILDPGKSNNLTIFEEVIGDFIIQA